MEVFTLSSFGEAGTWQYLIKADNATVTTGAIVMPDSATGHVGTIIEYDANDFTFFDRTGNTYNWVIGGTAEVVLTSGAFSPGVDDGN